MSLLPVVAGGGVGLFEICVKLAKTCLRKTIGNARLKYDELETVIIETKDYLILAL